MEENKAKALAKKAARLAEKQRLEEEAKNASTIDQSNQEETMDQSEGANLLANTITPQVTNEIPVWFMNIHWLEPTAIPNKKQDLTSMN